MPPHAPRGSNDKRIGRLRPTFSVRPTADFRPPPRVPAATVPLGRLGLRWLRLRGLRLYGLGLRLHPARVVLCSALGRLLPGRPGPGRLAVRPDPVPGPARAGDAAAV